VLSNLVSVHGSSQYLRSDDQPESVSRAILCWLLHSNIDTANIDPVSLGRTDLMSHSTANSALYP
jgi:hypothetical protein